MMEMIPTSVVVAVVIFDGLQFSSFFFCQKHGLLSFRIVVIVFASDDLGNNTTSHFPSPFVDAYAHLTHVGSWKTQ